jgi:hypothetical protein
VALADERPGAVGVIRRPADDMSAMPTWTTCPRSLTHHGPAARLPASRAGGETTVTDQRTETREAAFRVRLRIVALWTCLMFLYVYADLLSFFRPGELGEIMDGQMGPVDVSQTSLLVAGLVVIVPALMIVVAVTVPFPAVRWLNIVVGGLYVLVSATNLIGETWLYYWLFGALEIVLAGLVVWYAVRWRAAG